MQSMQQLIRALAHVVSGGTMAFVIKRCEERGHQTIGKDTRHCLVIISNRGYHRQRHMTLFCYLFELEKEKMAPAS